MKYIKIYGLPRSGTNYLKLLIEANFNNVRVLQNIGGSKHEKYDPNHRTIPSDVLSDIPDEEMKKINHLFQQEKIPYVCIIKDPAAWITSYSRYKGQKLTTNFIKEQLNYYHYLNNNWAILSHMVEYTQLLKNPDYVLTKIGCYCGLTIPKEFPYLYLENSTLRGGDTDYRKIISQKKFNSKYYINREYLKEFTKEQIDIIYNTIF